MNIRLILVALCVSLSFVASGCGKSGLKGLVPAKGTVTYKGQPLAVAAVTFVPQEKTLGTRPANAFTDENGRFTLMTLDPDDGILPGEYIVTVSKYTSTKIDEEAALKARRGEGPMPKMAPQKPLVPEKYMSQKTTDLKCTIGSKGDKNIVIELKD